MDFRNFWYSHRHVVTHELSLYHPKYPPPQEFINISFLPKDHGLHFGPKFMCTDNFVCNKDNALSMWY